MTNIKIWILDLFIIILNAKYSLWDSCIGPNTETANLNSDNSANTSCIPTTIQEIYFSSSK